MHVGIIGELIETWPLASRCLYEKERKNWLTCHMDPSSHAKLCGLAIFACELEYGNSNNLQFHMVGF